MHAPIHSNQLPWLWSLDACKAVSSRNSVFRSLTHWTRAFTVGGAVPLGQGRKRAFPVKHTTDVQCTRLALHVLSQVNTIQSTFLLSFSCTWNSFLQKFHCKFQQNSCKIPGLSFANPWWGITMSLYVGQTCWEKQTLVKVHFYTIHPAFGPRFWAYVLPCSLSSIKAPLEYLMNTWFICYVLKLGSIYSVRAAE